MRGAQNKTVLSALQERIIPAYAGSTYGKPRAVTHAKDHPRVCGEHWDWFIILPVPMGSSPRMRGAPSGSRNARQRRGIIPAYAGSTNTVCRYPTLPTDHPRVCGEHVGLTDIL